MNFTKVIETISSQLDTAEIRYEKSRRIVNAPRRAVSDWADIQMILEVASEQADSVDWNLLEDYLRLFDLED
ncbi:MAG: hypothetical protein ACLFU4_06105, partial [Opitutales bacterium]